MEQVETTAKHWQRARTHRVWLATGVCCVHSSTPTKIVDLLAQVTKKHFVCGFESATANPTSIKLFRCFQIRFSFHHCTSILHMQIAANAVSSKTKDSIQCLSISQKKKKKKNSNVSMLAPDRSCMLCNFVKSSLYHAHPNSVKRKYTT